MAHALDMTVIAEGVETAGQLEALVELGCDAAQGYLLARPLSSSMLTGGATATASAPNSLAAWPI